jgi:uncharacterized protein YdhG (YjbR/CyaY superfamily)
MLEVDEYVADLPENQLPVFASVIAHMRQTFPELTERISYGMPGFYYAGKPIIWFGAFKQHLGLYPEPAAVSAHLD